MALAITLAIELPVAGLFRVGRRGLGGVALVNVVTNPAAVLSAVLVYGSATGTWLVLALLGLIEILVIIVEWRLLRWALGESVGSSRKLLVMAVTMNAASALLPALLVAVAVSRV